MDRAKFEIKEKTPQEKAAEIKEFSNMDVAYQMDQPTIFKLPEIERNGTLPAQASLASAKRSRPASD